MKYFFYSLFPFLLSGENTGKKCRDPHSVPEGQHSFIMGAGRVPEVDEAIEQMGR